MGMLGTRSSDSALSGLVDIVSDPAKFKRSVAELKDATARHRAERDAAAKEKAEAVKAVGTVNAQLAELRAAETRVKVSQAKVDADRAAAAADRRTHEQRAAAFIGEMDASKAAHLQKVKVEETRLASLRSKLVQDQNASMQECDARLSAVKKELASIAGRKADLEAFSRKMDAKRDQVTAREEAVARLELDVRTRIKKLNELFPVN